MISGASQQSRIDNWVRARNEHALSLARRKQPGTSPATTTTINTNEGERNMFYAKFIVRKHERALLFRDGDFVKFLEPGVYRYVTVLHKYTVERFDITVPVFGHRLQDFLIEKYRADVERHFDIVTTEPNERFLTRDRPRFRAISRHTFTSKAPTGLPTCRLTSRTVLELRVARISGNTRRCAARRR